jgi:tetratricopeptide (TPR) repeat protein
MDPGNTGYMTHYAWFLHNNGFHEEAASVFTRLLPIVDDKKHLYRGLGWNLKVLGRLEASLSAYRKVFPLKSSDQNFRASFEEIRWILYKENAQSIKAIKLKLSAQPHNIELKEDLFGKYIEQGELRKAIHAAEEIRSEGQIDKPIHLQFARALFWLGDKRRAETEYRKLITDVPKNAFLYFELAQVLDANDRTSEAKTKLDVSLSIYPDSARTRKKLAEVLAKSGRGDEAADVAATITPSGDNRLTGLMARARAFHFGGRLDEARSIYKTVLDEYPYNTDALWGLTETSIYTGNYKASLATLARWNNAISDDRLRIQEELIDYYVSPVAGLKAAYYSNSSDFSRSDAGANYSFYAGKDSRLNAGYYVSDFRQDGFEDIFRHTLFAEGEMRVLEHFQLAGRLAGKFYDNDNDNLNGTLSAYFRPSRKITAALNYKHIDIIDTELPFGNTIYNYVVTMGAVGLDIKTDDYGLYLLYAPQPRISLAGEFIYGDYSDGNRKKSLMLETGYELSHIPYLRAAYNYFYLDFQDPAPLFTGKKRTESAYYDPINYETHTLRLEFRHDYGKRFSSGLEGAVSYIPKSDGTSGSAFASAAYRFGDHSALNFDARWFYQNRGIDRIGKTGHFWSRNFVLTFEYRF